MSRKASTILIFVFISGLAIASGHEEKVKGKHKRMLEEAEFFYSIEDHFVAKGIYAELVESYPENADFNFKLGYCYLHLRNEEMLAIPYLQKATQLDHTPAFYFLAEAYHMNEEFHEALVALDEYRQRKDRKLTQTRIDQFQNKIETAIHMMNNPIEVNIDKLGSNVNSEYQDYAPNIDAEGKYLYFTSRRPGGVSDMTDLEGDHFEDIFMSKHLEGSWTKAVAMQDPVNTEGHDANVNFTMSGNSLILYRTHKNLFAGDLYITNRNKSGWSKPERLGSGINTPSYHEPSAAMSPDEQMIFVVSDRPGGFGGKDIYLLRKLPNGEWSLPQNLGRKINSPFDEDAPFVSMDGRTLYFSSTGHNSIGGFDIYSSVMDKNAEWSEPRHLGYPINSVFDDIYFSMTADDKRGFFSSSRARSMDIYEVDMLYEVDDLVVVKGFVTEEDLPVSAMISFKEIGENPREIKVLNNLMTGKYVAAVRPDERYEMSVIADGYEEYKTMVKVAIDEKGEFNLLVHDVALKRKER